jgi:hypothetical protein
MEVNLEDLLPLYRLTKEQLKEKLKDHDFTLKIAKAYALKKKLHNGATMKIGGGYRNEGLFFWDDQNKEIVEPFTEIDNYGSVPPRFVVGDGYFNPNDWLDEVEHNTYVFPARPLINEMKEFAENSEKKMVVEINGTDYTVYYNQTDMKGNWDSCILEVHGPSFSVFPGDPRWRETIVDEDSVSTQEPDSVVASVLESFKQRAATGQKKYGTNLDRTDLKTLDWIQHLQEELMDATLYLEKLKGEFR